MPFARSAAAPRRLEVGNVAFLLDGAELRHVSLDGTELVRRLHVAVRDASWGTLEPDAVDVDVQTSADAVELRAEARHASALAELSWVVQARVEASGALSYAVELSPSAPFAYARMGLCLLLPPTGIVGRRYAAQTPGGQVDGTFAAAIGPQRVEDGELQPLFPSFSALRIDGALDCRFEGDLFEMEDQRNWSDGSFKAYGTPLSRPRPQHAEPGRPVRQRIALAPAPAATAAAGARPRVAAAHVEIDVAPEPAGARVPGLGLTLAAGAAGAAEDPATTGTRLRDLALDHVRVDLREPAHAAERLAHAAAVADAAGAALTVALHLPDAAAAGALTDALRPHAQRIAWLLALSREEPVSGGPLVAAARAQLADALPRTRFAGGTDLWFADLNRAVLDPRAMDGVVWALSPQVHGSDELTIVEALEPHADQVATARGLAPGLDLLVGPITLRPRYNPAAADAQAQALDPPPAATDPRQGDPFAAAWTAASVGQLAGAGVAAATYCETSGPRGVLAPDGAGVLPCWHPLADAGGWRGWDVLPTRSAQPLAAQALVVRSPDGAALGALVANLRDEPTAVRLAGLPAGGVRVRVLDARTRAHACAEPAAFRAAVAVAEHPRKPDGALRLDLAPHAVATVIGGV